MQVTKYSAQLVIRDSKKFITEEYIKKHDQYDKYAIQEFIMAGKNKQTVIITFWKRPLKATINELKKLGELSIEKHVNVYNRYTENGFVYIGKEKP
jgi:hypothetical protein